MNKSDRHLVETLQEIKKDGVWSKNPRTKWKDGSVAHYKSIYQKSFVYDISKGEFPINTLRPTAIKGGFYDMEAIYIKQTNIIEEMHPSIHSWWEDFVVQKLDVMETINHINNSISVYYRQGEAPKVSLADENTPLIQHQIGQTYGHTVKRYNLVDKLLKSMSENPESRRHIIDLWQEEQMSEDSKALVPCAYKTEWYVIMESVDRRRVNFTLTQRSMDVLMTFSINPIQYILLAIMVCNHLTFVTGVEHYLGTFKHDIGNLHVYDRHMEALDELLSRKPTGIQPTVSLICQPKDFYSHVWEDFEVKGIEGIKPLSERLEIAI